MKFIKPIHTGGYEAVILLPHKYGTSPYYIELEIIYDGNIPKTCAVMLCPTKMPVSETEKVDSSFYVKWGGYPNFIQNEVIPVSDDGRPYTFLCTVENGWGDGGNCNVFILLKESEYGGLAVEDCYMEASCH